MVPDGNVFTLFFALLFFSILDLDIEIRIEIRRENVLRKNV